MKLFFLSSGLILLSLIIGSKNLSAQTNAQNIYVSTVDQDLTIKSIVLVPTADNVEGIYARPVEEELQELLNKDTQWALVKMPKDIKIKSQTLEDQPQEVQQLLKSTNTQAALTSKVIRGPKGISITLTLFVGREGLPLLQEKLSNYPGFETAQIREEARNLFEKIKAKMPFRASILSRRGQQVTLNLGSNYGVKAENRVSVVQIIKINRHPKLNFMVSTEKEVLGRVKLFKVEPYLSFGYVEMEKDPGVITVGAKVMPDEFIKYSTPITTPSGKILHDISTRPDKELAFGEDPQEWLPTTPPQFGKIELMAGIGNYTQNTTLNSAGSFSGSNNFTPNILARAELWLNPEWFIGAHLRQSVFSISNDQPGSTPSSLNLAMAQYKVTAGYNFLLTSDFFGPKMQLSAGYLNTKFSVDNSTPSTFTSMNYGSFLLSVAGQFPLSEETPIDIGAKLDFYMNTSLSESQSSGDSSDNTLNSFSFFIDYRLKTRFKIRGELLIENYSSDFSGAGERADPASNTSHKLTTLFGGIQYLF